MLKKVVIDCNIWISFLISSTGESLLNLISNQAIILLVSNELIGEFEDTAMEQKFRRYFSIYDISELSKFLRQYGKLIFVTSDLELCRDPKDNFLLNLSIDGNADYLITGDKDLLILKKVENTKIVTLKEFEAIVNQ